MKKNTQKLLLLGVLIASAQLCVVYGDIFSTIGLVVNVSEASKKCQQRTGKSAKECDTIVSEALNQCTTDNMLAGTPKSLQECADIVNKQ